MAFLVRNTQANCVIKFKNVNNTNNYSKKETRQADHIYDDKLDLFTKTTAESLKKYFYQIKR